VSIFWVGLGGFLGAVARFQFGRWIAGLEMATTSMVAGFPLATLGVNAIGSFLIGFVAFFHLGGNPLSGDVRYFLMTGLLGGFTTFSAFSLETLQLLESGAMIKAMLNVLCNVGLCLLFVWLGASVSRLAFS